MPSYHTVTTQAQHLRPRMALWTPAGRRVIYNVSIVDEAEALVSSIQAGGGRFDIIVDVMSPDQDVEVYA